MPSRYYSQQYSRLDEPDPLASSSNIGLDHYPDPHPDHQMETTEYHGNRDAFQLPPVAYEDDNSLKKPKTRWSRKQKIIVFGSSAALLVIVAIVVGVAVALTRQAFSYTPSYAQVTNSEAFTTGGATHNSPNDTTDGIGAGQDTYTYYSGPASKFPASDSWISFTNMWEANLHTLQTSCGVLGEGKDNS